MQREKNHHHSRKKTFFFFEILVFSILEFATLRTWHFLSQSFSSLARSLCVSLLPCTSSSSFDAMSVSLLVCYMWLAFFPPSSQLLLYTTSYVLSPSLPLSLAQLTKLTYFKIAKIFRAFAIGSYINVTLMNSALEKVRHSPFKCSIVGAACFLFVASIHSRAFEIPNRSMYLLVRNGFCVRNQCIWVCLIARELFHVKHILQQATRACVQQQPTNFGLCYVHSLLLLSRLSLIWWVSSNRTRVRAYSVPKHIHFTSKYHKKNLAACAGMLSHSLSLSAVFKLVVFARVSL